MSAVLLERHPLERTVRRGNRRLDATCGRLVKRQCRCTSCFKRELQLNELQAACDAGVHALVTVYHSDHRKLYAHERDWPFCIVNILELVGESMGLHRNDRYKRLKMMQDVDQIVAEWKRLAI